MSAGMENTNEPHGPRFKGMPAPLSFLKQKFTIQDKEISLANSFVSDPNPENIAKVKEILSNSVKSLSASDKDASPVLNKLRFFVEKILQQSDTKILSELSDFFYEQILGGLSSLSIKYHNDRENGEQSNLNLSYESFVGKLDLNEEREKRRYDLVLKVIDEYNSIEKSARYANNNDSEIINVIRLKAEVALVARNPELALRCFDECNNTDPSQIFQYYELLNRKADVLVSLGLYTKAANTYENVFKYYNENKKELFIPFQAIYNYEFSKGFLFFKNRDQSIDIIANVFGKDPLVYYYRFLGHLNSLIYQAPENKHLSNNEEKITDILKRADNFRKVFVRRLNQKVDSIQNDPDISSMEKFLKRLLLVNLKIEILQAKDAIINNHRGVNSNHEFFSQTKESLIKYIDFINRNSEKLDLNYKNLLEDCVQSRNKMHFLNNSHNFYKAIKVLLGNHYELHTELAFLEVYKSLNDLDFNNVENWLLKYISGTRHLPGFDYSVDTVKLLLDIFKTVYEEQDNQRLCFLDDKGRITTHQLKLPTWITNFKGYLETLKTVNEEFFQSLQASASFYFDFETYTIKPKI